MALLCLKDKREWVKMKKVVKIVLILAVILLVLGVAAFCYIKSMIPNGDGNNDIVEGYYKSFRSEAPLEMKYSQLGSLKRPIQSSSDGLCDRSGRPAH
jgi:hypothetical protein